MLHGLGFVIRGLCQVYDLRSASHRSRGPDHKWVSSRRPRFNILKAFFLLTFPFLSLFFTSTPALSVKVSAEGVEPIGNRDIRAVKEAAISNALKTAVEKVAKSVSADLQEEHINTLRGDKDYLNYIKAYRVLYELSSGKSYKVAVEADVDSEGLKNKIKELLGFKNKTPLNPSVSILVLKNSNSDPIINSVSLRDVKREIAVVLIGSGYVVVEPPGDIVLETYAGIKTTEIATSDNKYYTFGTVYIRAKDKNGKLLAETGDSFYSAGNGSVEICEEVLKQAASRTASKLKSELDKMWKGRDDSIDILLTGFRSYEQYAQLDEALSKSVLAIDSIDKRVFENGKVTFVVFSLITPQELAATLANLPLPGFSLKLNKVSFNKIEFDVVQK
ncbi:MAG TPA: hypothetical protein VLB01_01840 [Thermodesulfobacteriota bacterium]|nr:hypothetical protein [Thermodesulfobacteriota bacterium]